MKANAKNQLLKGTILIALFAVLTYLVQVVNVKPLGANNTDIGFSTINCFVHKLLGVHMALYTITDWAGLVPIFVAFIFAIIGLMQLIKRKSLLKVDCDILILGVYYIIVIALYLIFEAIPINYRPVLINGFLETSYPSSTTLLVLSVNLTLIEQICRRCKNSTVKTIVCSLTVAFSLFMVIGRLISGVHWFTDILGSVLLSFGLFYVYKGLVLLFSKEF